MSERARNFPAQLSGGEQQRVAIARALAKNPKLLLCDEPTGALDYQTGKQILKLLQDTCRERGVCVIVITHNLALTAMGDKSSRCVTAVLKALRSMPILCRRKDRVLMRSALLKDILREIRKSLGRFLSILLIVALGVAFFAGVKASVPDMKYTADAYFDEYNMQDIQLISTVGFTDEDVDAIRQIEGVKGVHATYSMDALTTKGSKQITLKVLAMPSLDPDRDDPNYINQVRLVDAECQKTAENV